MLVVGLGPEVEPADELSARALDGCPEAEPVAPLVVLEERGQDLLLDLRGGVGRPPVMNCITSGSLSSSTRRSASSSVKRRSTRRSVSRKTCTSCRP
jgi:hypothetical protein